MSLALACRRELHLAGTATPYAVLFVLALSLLVPGQKVHAFEGHEAVVWTETGLRYKVNKKLAVDWRGYWRMKDYKAATDKVMTQLSLRWRARRVLRLTLGYRHIQEMDKRGDFEGAHRFYLDSTLRKTLKPLVLSYRLRLQREGGESSDGYEDRVRNKLELQWKMSKRWRPLISTEHFYTGEKEGWVHTRFRNTFGVELHLGGHAISLLYRHNWPIDDEDDPLTHILGLGYGFEW